MVRFLIDANMPRDTAAVLQRCGYGALDVRDIGLADAPDSHIADCAKQQQLCLPTRDTDFGDVRRYPPKPFAGIVVLEFPPTARAEFILRVVEELALQADLLMTITGKLALVRGGHIRIRE